VRNSNPKKDKTFDAVAGGKEECPLSVFARAAQENRVPTIFIFFASKSAPCLAAGS